MGNLSGDNRTRTCDPLHVKQMLSQLSYVSILIKFFILRISREYVEHMGFEPTTSTMRM